MQKFNFNSTTRHFRSLLLGMMLVFTFVSGWSQQPLAYWSFEDSLGVADSAAGGNFNLNDLVANIRLGNTAGQVGQYLSLDTLQSPGQRTLDDSLWLHRSAVSFECWVRPGQDMSFGEILGWGRLVIRIGETRLLVRWLDERGFAGRNSFFIRLNGVGRRDPNYLRDGNWHHLAVSFNTKNGLAKLYVDGISPPGFSKNIGNGMRIYNSPTIFSFTPVGRSHFKGDIDEVAVYDSELSAEMVWQHYQNGLNHQHYNFVLQPGQLPVYQPSVQGAINPLEFPPGYPFTTLNSLDMLYHYPSARYRPQDTILPRNIPWVNDIRTLANSTNQALLGPIATNNAAQAAQMTKYLAQEYNYYLWLGTTASAITSSYYSSPAQMGYHLVPVADSFPELPRFTISNWHQLNKTHLFPTRNTGPFVLSAHLADTFYVRDINGNVITRNFWAWPAAEDSRADTLANDGRVQAYVFIDTLIGHLANNRLDLIGENGEVLNPRDTNILRRDPRIIQDKGSLAWDPYQSSRARKFRKIYSDIFLDHLDSVQAPGLPRPDLYWYNVSGNQGPSRFTYDSMRTINSEIGGRRRASPYYYPQSPARWRFNGNNILPGFQEVIQGRATEISLGDSMYLPGISPGLNDGVYNAPDERRIRPGQMLGILKGHAMLGADAYNLFMFNGTNNRFQGNWTVWELLVPPLAQA
ncbi:MAG TPA: LamG domain-containing protein, partial [Bacteroidetes bacterium]|nr:LamG domain-containing protein [Bacteroidota bacterium]